MIIVNEVVKFSIFLFSSSRHRAKEPVPGEPPIHHSVGGLFKVPACGKCRGTVSGEASVHQGTERIGPASGGAQRSL